VSRAEEAFEAELAALVAQARGYLELESELGASGLPRVALEPLEPRRPMAPSSERSSARSAASTAGRGSSQDPSPDARKGASAPARSAADSISTVPPTLSAERLPLAERTQRLTQLADDAQHCTRCDLHAGRKQSVFARGNPEAELVFVGEGPGAEEDRLGEPFVGPAGKLLDRMVAAMGYDRDDIYICNVVKCRPPENRTPRPEEAIACRRYLVPQLELVAPKVIVALGRCAAENLGVAKPEGPWRGRWGAFQGIPVLPTYHPAYLLRSPEQKRVVWDDLKLVLARLGRPVPSPKR
jgi:DNA polymerase